MNNEISNCDLVTIWNNGVELSLPAVYNPETGEFHCVENFTLSTNPETGIDEEYLLLYENTRGNREELLICPKCKKYTMVFSQKMICRDPKCSSNKEKISPEVYGDCDG
jgi:hypothetical protein